MRREEILKSFFGYELPAIPSPVGAYVPVVRIKGLLFLSGLLPLKNGKLIYQGRVGKDITIEEAKECALQVVLNCFSLIKSEIGNLESIKRCVRINGYLQTIEDFKDHSAVLNAASELIINVFGDAGRHTRIVVGVSSLPMNSPLELDFIWSLED